MTRYDDYPPRALRAELVYACALRGIEPGALESHPLWIIASMLGIHRIETRADHDAREIVETKQEYWTDTEAQRTEKLEGYSERRRQRQMERRQARAKEKREEKASLDGPDRDG